MGVFARREQKERRPDAAPITEVRKRYKANFGDTTLPGIAGYQGLDRVGRRAMPHDRFVYKRPDGRPE
jgi:hypothetical protein